MSNYVYIIAGLPVLQKDAAASSHANPNADEIIDEIRSLLSDRDAARLDFLLKGFDSENLNANFYSEAIRSRSEFIRRYFAYDLLVRNTRTAWLNKSLGRVEGTDIVSIEQDTDDSEEARAIYDVLSQKDILARERDLDSLMWNRIEEINVMKVFDLDVILGFVARLKIVDRWIKLDPQTGRELFRKLVEEIRSSTTEQKQ